MKQIHYIVYKTTNLVNGKIYIGAHKTSDLNDGYMGSGHLINKAFSKYGKDNFKTEILYELESLEEMYSKEAELVNEEFLKRNDVYNIKLGGQGGWDHLNSNSDIQRAKCLKGNAKMKLLRDTDVEWKNNKSINISNGLKKAYKDDIKKASGFPSSASINAQSEAAKTKRKDTFKEMKFQQGENNSQFGKVWIYHPKLQVSFAISKDYFFDYHLEGFLKGRKLKW